MIYNNLPSADINTFCSYVRTYAAGSDASIYGDMADPKHILRFWENAKEKYLYNAFGEQFILEKEIEFSQSRKEIYHKIDASIEYGEMSSFKSLYRKTLIEEFGYSDEYYFLLRLVDKNNLTDNIAKTLPYNTEVTFKNGKKIKLNNNSKTIKLLGKVCKILGIEVEFEVFRLQHSLILNKKKLKGTLCLSIHPMDYLTMSDNDNGWTSCMSWEEDGDYRMGTIEMMNSPNVVVAYLKSDDRVYSWSDQEWNSKMWRTLIIVDPAVIVSVKAYPYQHDDLTRTCIEWLRELVEHNLNWNFPYAYSEIKEDSNFKINGRSARLLCYTNKMYNDFGTVEHYGIISDKFTEFNEITYSGETECIWCGGTSGLFEDCNFVTCSECSDGGSKYVYCFHCGDSYDEDEIYWVEDEPLCSYCFEEYASTCAITGLYFYKDNLTEVFLSRIDDHPDTNIDYSIHICNSYLEEENYANGNDWIRAFINSEPKRDVDSDLYYWNMSDLTARGLWRFFGVRLDN